MSFGKSAAIAARYRFVQPIELRKALTQFCSDFGIVDPGSIAMMENRQVFDTSLTEFWQKRTEFFAPDPNRDALGKAAADFMGAEALALLFGYTSALSAVPITAPLVDGVMRRGARGLYRVGQAQFEELAQICVDLSEWLVRSQRTEVVLIEAPLGNSVPVAVLRYVVAARGVDVRVVEWGCPRNDRALNGRTVTDSAKDLARDPVVAAAPFVLFLDDAITGSRFLKMGTALRNAVGPARFGAVAMRVKYHPSTRLPTGQRRSLRQVDAWAQAIGMPFGNVALPDLPLFRPEGGLPGFLETALAWGDAGHSAGKRKVNILFNFIDRFEAITRELGTVGESQARSVLVQKVWNTDTSGGRFITPPDIAEKAFVSLVMALPTDFFERLRLSAKQAFPQDYYGRSGSITSEPDLRRRTDWLEHCIGDAARTVMTETEARCLNRAVNELSQAGYTAGIDKPPRDHDYGHYTVPMPPGEDRLHLELVDLIVASASTHSPRP